MPADFRGLEMPKQCVPLAPPQSRAPWRSHVPCRRAGSSTCRRSDPNMYEAAMDSVTWIPQPVFTSKYRSRIAI